MLCGTCSDAHGKVGIDCRRCLAKPVVVAVLLLSVLWFLALLAIAIRGNCIANCSSTRQSSVRRVEERAIPEGDSLRSVVVHMPGNHARQAVRSPGLIASPPDQDVYEYAKRNVAERFKVIFVCFNSMVTEVLCQLFVNFAQVNSMALAINTNWKSSARRIFEALGKISSYPEIC